MSNTKLDDSTQAVQTRLRKARKIREDKYKRAKQICKEADLEFVKSITLELDEIPWLTVTDLCNKIPMSRPNVYRLLSENPEVDLNLDLERE